MPQPTVGRIVHYTSYGAPGGEYPSVCRAAIVTEVTQVEVNEKNLDGDGVFRETVGLCVLNPEGMYFSRGVVYVDGPSQGGTWHWPERYPPFGSGEGGGETS